MSKRFPKTLFVTIDGDGDAHWYVADDDATVLADKKEAITIATYQLVETRKLRLTTSLTEVD